jgi:hypothetical protein
MQDKAIRRADRGCNPPFPEDADAFAQQAVMALVLTEHPAQLTSAEVEREIAQGGDFADRDAVQRAVRDLAGVGLLHRHGDFVLPTRAVLHFDWLDCGNP